MSLAAACGWTLARCVIVLLLAIPAAWLVQGLLKRLPRRPARWGWGLLLLAIVSPELLAGYAYSSAGFKLGSASPRVEIVYALLLVIRCIPLGTVVWYFAPPPAISDQGKYCADLLDRKDRQRLPGRVSFQTWFDRIQSGLPSAAIIFLVAFQEFELASRLGAASWTVWLFDAQAGGLKLSESLKLALLPLTIEGVVILTILCAIARRRRETSMDDHPITPRLGRVGQVCAWSVAILCCVALCLGPVAAISPGIPAGLSLIARDPTLRFDLPRIILRTAGLAIVAGVSVYWLAGTILSQRLRRWLVVSLCSLPGLTGSLVVGLTMLALFQSGPAHRFYDTPIPLLLALIVVLFPRAVLLQLLLQAAESREAWRLALLLRESSDDGQQMAGTRLGWELRERGRFWGAALLCHWAYWELPASAMLAPTGMESAPVRLYNFMHYSHGAVLSAMLATTVIVPLLLFGLLGQVRRSVWKWCGR